MSWESVLKVKRPRRFGTTARGRRVSKPTRFTPTRTPKPKPKPVSVSTPERFQPDDDAKEPTYEGGPTMPYGKPMISGDVRRDLDKPRRQDDKAQTFHPNVNPSMDSPTSVDIPPNERERYLTMDSNPEPDIEDPDEEDVRQPPFINPFKINKEDGIDWFEMLKDIELPDELNAPGRFNEPFPHEGETLKFWLDACKELIKEFPNATYTTTWNKSQNLHYLTFREGSGDDSSWLRLSVMLLGEKNTVAKAYLDTNFSSDTARQVISDLVRKLETLPEYKKVVY